jgi:GTPase SAR1 family protein
MSESLIITSFMKDMRDSKRSCYSQLIMGQLSELVTDNNSNNSWMLLDCDKEYKYKKIPIKKEEINDEKDKKTEKMTVAIRDNSVEKKVEVRPIDKRIKLFVIGSYKVGKTTLVESISGLKFINSSQIDNTHGEIIYHCNISTHPGQVTKPILLFDTEGFNQPVSGLESDVSKQIILEHIRYTADIVIYMVDRVYKHDIEILRELYTVLKGVHNIKGFIVIHNVKSIQDKKTLEAYARKHEHDLGLLPTNDTLKKEQYLDGGDGTNTKTIIIEHLYIGDKSKLKDIYNSTMREILNKLYYTPSAGVDYHEQLLNAIKVVLFKYYEFDYERQDILKVDNKPHVHKILAGGIKKRAGFKDDIWDPIYIKINVGDRRQLTEDGKTKFIVDVEVDCSGMLLSGEENSELITDEKDDQNRRSSIIEDKRMKITIIDLYTFIVTGYKRKIGKHNKDFIDCKISEKFTLPYNILQDAEYKIRMMQSFKRTDYNTIIGHIYLNM